jgi:WD40 repeat protein
MKNVTADLDE